MRCRCTTHRPSIPRILPSLVAVALGILGSLAAWTGAGTPASATPLATPTITFGPTGVTATLTPGWGDATLYLFLVPSKATAGKISGSSGTLSVAYPRGYCGLAQADLPTPGHGWGPGVVATIGCGHAPVVVTPSKAATPGGTGNGGSPTGTGGGPTLPFTGLNIWPMVSTGLGLIAAGAGCLVWPDRTRRRDLVEWLLGDR